MERILCETCEHLTIRIEHFKNQLDKANAIIEKAKSEGKVPYEVYINSFVRRQTAESSFTHWTISDEELLARIEENFHLAKQGYRPDVLLVPVNPSGFYAGVITLQPGDKLVGEYSARREGEQPRIHVYSVNGSKKPAKAVDVVLYSHAALVEGCEHESNSDYEIVSINGRDSIGDQPIEVMTLLANHFGADGGTATNLTPEKLESMLRESFEYWKDKALVNPQPR